MVKALGKTAILNRVFNRDSDALKMEMTGLTEHPIVNVLTVPATEVELKAGGIRLTGRKQLIIYPPSAGSIYWGASGLSSSNGAPLKSTDPPLVFDISGDFSIYAVNDGTNRDIRVVEAK